MCRLIESIKIDTGQICNPSYHTRRLNETRRALFGADDTIEITDSITVPREAMNGIYKCRVIYSEKIIDVTFEKYTRRNIGTLKLVYDDEIDYPYKYEDKTRLLSLREFRETCDDILIVKNGNISDTSFSNIAFYDGRRWITPAAPLLKGTKRAYLLTEGLITEDDITVSNIRLFRKASLINAMLELGDTVFSAGNIC
jgi:4-amino-4-deoxychorismate lyase